MDNTGHLDFETYSQLDIRRVGGHRYARHPSTEVLICSYMLPGMAEPETWLPRTQKRIPRKLAEYVATLDTLGGELGAHNANFERLIWKHVLRRDFPELPEIPDTAWVCTAATAAASGLPRALDKALEALELDVRKDENGSAFIKRFCKPRKPTKKDPRTRILPEDDPEAFDLGVAYCEQDVRGEAALHAALFPMIKREREFFWMDMAMNDRGLPIDIPLVEKAYAIIQELDQDVAEEVQRLTGGIKATQVAKLKDYLNAALSLDGDDELDGMKAAGLKEFLKGEVDPKVRRILELRMEGGKASTKKLFSMLTCADPDDWVVQGGFLYHGAHTGRYAGRLVQPHNFIRGTLKDHQRATVFALLEYGDANLFRLLYKNPIDVIAQCMRGFIAAPRGYELAVCDYTAIEARVLAWVAGEEHMLAAYRQGVDVYKLTASKLFKVAIEDVSDEQRRLAKNLVLGCGYQLGGDRFVEYCKGMGMEIDPDFAAKAVKLYRKNHPNIVASWGIVQQAAGDAIRNPGKTYRAVKCEFRMRRHWLCVRLPSGREIRYPYARCALVERYGRPAYEISFKTEYKGRFYKEKTYGGKLIENIVQAIARDVMMEGMWNAEHGGYPVLGTVHDEALTLRRKGTSDIKELERLMCDIPKWGRGIPLGAKGFVCDRYKKD